MNFIDLFCGIGGFHQALSPFATCVFACDIDAKCRQIYEKNYNIKPEGDITSVNIPSIQPFDILCAGFPCQPFSKAGFQKGFEDARGNLFFTLCEIVKYHMPKYLILENVRNLASHDKNNTWKTIHHCIHELGYNTYDLPVILNVLHFNIPQNRERVIIMCKRKDLGDLSSLPTIPCHPKKMLTRSISEFMDAPTTQLTGKLKVVESIWDSFVGILTMHKIIIPKFPIWTDWWDNNITDGSFYNKYTNWICKNRDFYTTYKEILEPWLIQSRQHKLWTGAVRKFEWQASSEHTSLKQVLWTPRGSGIRAKNIDYIPTLVAMSMIPIYGPESRKLSPRELLRLQAFPDTFQYDEKTILKQIGNSVCVKMIEQCARFLIYNEPLL